MTSLTMLLQLRQNYLQNYIFTEKITRRLTDHRASVSRTLIDINGAQKIKLAHRKLSKLWTRLYFLEYRYSVKILLKNTSELFTQCTADAFAIHVSAFLFTFVKYLRIFAITSTLYRLWQEIRYM